MLVQSGVSAKSCEKNRQGSVRWVHLTGARSSSAAPSPRAPEPLARHVKCWCVRRAAAVHARRADAALRGAVPPPPHRRSQRAPRPPAHLRRRPRSVKAPARRRPWLLRARAARRVTFPKLPRAGASCRAQRDAQAALASAGPPRAVFYARQSTAARARRRAAPSRRAGDRSSRQYQNDRPAPPGARRPTSATAAAPRRGYGEASRAAGLRARPRARGRGRCTSF